METCKTKDFIRKNKSGELNYERLKGIVMEIATEATFYPDHNILIDSRETTLQNDFGMTDIIRIARDVSIFRHLLTNRIAYVIPNDEDRLSKAENAETIIQVQGIQYKVFTDYGDAIEWLSEIKPSEDYCVSR